MKPRVFKPRTIGKPIMVLRHSDARIHRFTADYNGFSFFFYIILLNVQYN